jgi:imidazolonepropionase-like amidohydrolase
MGTDCGYPPCPHGTNALELELMMQYGGMSAMKAILTSTKNAAEALGMGEKLGTIEKGKWADIVVVNADPLKNIGVLQKKSAISMVMKQGKIQCRTLDKQL